MLGMLLLLVQENGADAAAGSGFWDFLSGAGEGFSMYAIYTGCALIGGTVLILQLIMLLFGLGDTDTDFDVDGDFDSDGGDSMGFLSIRALAGFLAFFGLTGMGGLSSGWHPLLTMGLASLAGLLMLFSVAWLMSMYKKLNAQGNLEPVRGVGMVAKVYLRVPGGHSGKGKVTISIQGREVQYEATTAGEEIPTGSEVRITGMTTGDTYEVEPLHGPPA